MTDIDLSLPTNSVSEDDFIWGLIRSRAKTAPDAVAITAPGHQAMTYSSLAGQMEKVVHTLNDLSIGRGDRVAMVLRNGPEMATAFLSVSACAVSAPLNPGYQPGEFDFYLSDIDAKALVVEKGMPSPARDIAAARGIPVVELCAGTSAEAGVFTLHGHTHSRSINGGFSSADDTALVLHTSGTTSRPKVVPLTQRNLCISARNISLSLALTDRDRCLNVMPLFHIHGLAGALLASIAAGAGIICSSGFSEDAFFEWLELYRPTWYTAVPTMHQAVLAKASSQGKIPLQHSLRFIRSCSSPLPPNIFEGLENTFGVPVIESYGMTEASHQMTSNPLPPGTRKAGSVGLPAGVGVGIMNATGNIIDNGGVGEIVVRGGNVTAGYENNSAANQSSFTNGWFRTGDQGYLDGEGYLFITGRIKEIINRGGEKIAPREVDEALLTHPAVAQAVTFAVPHPTIGEDVAAAVILRDKEVVSESALRKYLFGRLADFKIPSRVIVVDRIPKGPTGKLQRIGLYQQFSSMLKADFVPPRNEPETILAAIWKGVLKTPQVSIHDNFFYLGGDSLLAARLVSRIQHAFEIEYSLVNIFREPTIAEQANTIGNLLLDEMGELSEEEAARLE
jgi:acyl-CoA synthetase (AMP-forming)/AMP-acid ligase II